jgi:hypothetical protein
MRLAAKNIDPAVALAPGSVRPIRLRAGTSVTFMFTKIEAIALANQIVNVVEELNKLEGQAP